jgi:DNA-binding transcriptional MerR regulator
MPKKIGDMILYSVLEVSKMSDITPTTLRKYLKEGKLKGQKIGNRYFISEKNIKTFFGG